MKLRWIFFLIVTASQFYHCATPRMGLNKAHLLDATMDPAKTGVAVTRLQDQPANFWEKSNTSSGSTIGGSCPTCGT